MMDDEEFKKLEEWVKVKELRLGTSAICAMRRTSTVEGSHQGSAHRKGYNSLPLFKEEEKR